MVPSLHRFVVLPGSVHSFHAVYRPCCRGPRGLRRRRALSVGRSDLAESGTAPRWSPFGSARLRAFGRPLTATLGLLPVPPSPSRLLQDWYPAAYVDGVLVNHLVGRPGEPFWVQAYPSFIRWLKLAAELAGMPEPDLRQVAEFAVDPDRLAAFVAQAEALGAADASSDYRRTASNLRRWHDEEWLGLPSRLRANLAAGFQVAAQSSLQLSRRTRSGGVDRVPLGRRCGPWSEWGLELLPGPLAQAVAAARREVFIPADSSSSASTPVAGPVSPVLPQSLRRHLHRRLTRLVVGADDLVVRTRAVATELRQELAYRGLPGRAHPARERELFAALGRASVELVDQALALTGLLELVAPPAQAEWRERVADLRRSAPLPAWFADAEDRQQPAPVAGPLSGHWVCFIGTLSVTRAAAMRLAVAAGAGYMMLPSAKTTLVVTGTLRKPSRGLDAVARRVERGQSLDVVDEAEFRRRAGC